MTNVKVQISNEIQSTNVKSTQPSFPKEDKGVRLILEFDIHLAGKWPASPALWAGSRGTIKMKYPFREAPACSRGASHLDFAI
jgi:hypothetical protein